MSADITAEKYRAGLADELFTVYRNEVAGHEMDPETATRDGIYAILDHLVARGHLTG